jgi:hypothetical protein
MDGTNVKFSVKQPSFSVFILAFKNERFLASGNPVRTGFDAVCTLFATVSGAFEGVL